MMKHDSHFSRTPTPPRVSLKITRCKVKGKGSVSVWERERASRTTLALRERNVCAVLPLQRNEGRKEVESQEGREEERTFD